MLIDLRQNTENTLITGLGNVGRQYSTTRHNTGFMFIDRLQSILNERNYNNKTSCCKKYFEISFTKTKLFLIKPKTMMNLSGKAVQSAMAFHNVSLEDLIVVHDDLDLSLGEYKISIAKGPRTHNGVISIENVLKSNKFTRIRIGIENRLDKKVPGLDYVLMDFNNEEKKRIDKTIVEIINKEFIF